MAGFQMRVAGYNLPDNSYVEKKPSQMYYFNTGGVYEEVTPYNYQMNLYRPETAIEVYENNQRNWLPAGTRFYVETVAAPPVLPPVWTYFNGSQWIPLESGQIPVYWFNQQTYNVNSLQDVEFAKNQACVMGIQYPNRQISWLAAGTYFFQNTPTTVVIPPAPVPSSPYGSETFPPPRNLDTQPSQSFQPPPMREPSVLPEPKSPIVLPEPPPRPSLSESQITEPDPMTTTLKALPKKKCNECGKMISSYTTLFKNIICDDCVINKICERKLSSTNEGSVTNWSSRIIAELYMKLSKLPADANRAKLPSTIPLPLDSDVCIARNEPIEVNYPAEGHIIGLPNLVKEGGCPNGHVLCKGCATNLTYCPKCQAFVPYLELPAGCPKFPGHPKHCSGFDKSCDAEEGCSAGPWPRKKRPEEAKVEEPKVQPPVEEAKGEPPAAEELPKPKAEIDAPKQDAKIEEQPPIA